MESQGGFVELLYKQLAIKKKKTGVPLFVFWDKQCLNSGQDWEQGFVNGIKTSSVIVLLISSKV